MFDSLDETMKHDAEAESTPRERAMKYIITAVLAVVIFTGVIMGIRMLN